jgi:two-component system LytT family response regulator
MPKDDIFRAVLVDDEALARTYLKELLAEHAQVELVAECQNGFEAVKACAEHEPDLIFLDIQMPKLDGFEVLDLIDPGIRVIFVTAYDQYALKAFEVHAVDYLLKPFSAERLAEALARVGSEAAQSPDAARLVQEARGPAGSLTRIAVRDGAAVQVFPVADLTYAQAQDDYVELVFGQERVLKHQTLTSLAEALDPRCFVRIHRSTLVNIDCIERIEPWTKDVKLVILTDGTQLHASRSGYRLLRQVMDG